MSNCPKCNSTVPSGASFCGNCGAKIGACPTCGTQLPDGALFCGNCGTKINHDSHSQNTCANTDYHSNYNNQNFAYSYTTTPNQSSNQTKNCEDLINEWKSESKLNKLIYEQVWGYIWAILGVLTILLHIENKNFILRSIIEFGVETIEFILPANISSLLLKPINNLSQILFEALPFLEKAMFISMIPAFIISDICDIILYNIRFRNKFYNWCFTKSHSLFESIKSSLTTNQAPTLDHIAATDCCLLTLLNNQNSKIRKWLYAEYLYNLIFTHGLFGIPLIYLLYIFVYRPEGAFSKEILRRALLLGRIIEEEPLAAIIVLMPIVVLLIADYVIRTYVINRNIKLEQENWVRNNMFDKLETYRKYYKKNPYHD